MRIPFTVLEHCYIEKAHTWDDIFTVSTWSMKCLLSGKYPTSRPDGSEWKVSNGWRKKKNGLTLPFCGILLEVWGDWKAFKDIFRFPGWRDASGICWMCNCSVEDLRLTPFESKLKQPENRFTHWGFLQKQLELNRSTSTLFSTPFLETSCFLVGWPPPGGRSNDKDRPGRKIGVGGP